MKNERSGVESLLILTGSMGAGKSVVLGEASDLLAERQITHAAVDLDAFGMAYLPSRASTDDVMYENLRSVYRNYAALGVSRFLLARAIEHATELARCREIIPATTVMVCRLTASVEAMNGRVEMREPGLLLPQRVARVAALNIVLDRAHLEDFCVANESRSLTQVALEVLVKAGWISG
jgi:hypothetical protein